MNLQASIVMSATNSLMITMEEGIALAVIRAAVGCTLMQADYAISATFTVKCTNQKNILHTNISFWEKQRLAIVLAEH